MRKSSISKKGYPRSIFCSLLRDKELIFQEFSKLRYMTLNEIQQRPFHLYNCEDVELESYQNKYNKNDSNSYGIKQAREGGGI